MEPRKLLDMVTTYKLTTFIKRNVIHTNFSFKEDKAFGMINLELWTTRLTLGCMTFNINDYINPYQNGGSERLTKAARNTVYVSNLS